jgi:hypothetical protein
MAPLNVLYVYGTGIPAGEMWIDLSQTNGDIVIESTIVIGGVTYTVTTLTGSAFRVDSATMMSRITLPDTITALYNPFEGLSNFTIVMSSLLATRLGLTAGLKSTLYAATNVTVEISAPTPPAPTPPAPTPPAPIYAPQDFYLVEDFSCNATGVTAAYFDAAATPDVSGNFPNKAEILVSKTVVQELFQYWTDSIDMTDVSANDILYRVYYNAADSSNAPLSSLFVSGAIVTATEPNTNPYNLNRRYLPQDYLRYLALKLFNTTKGVDLFANETEVLMSVDVRCKVALNARLSALTGETPGAIARDRSDFKVTMNVTSPDGPGTIIAGTLDTTANPSKKILRQIMQNDPQRLDLTGAAFDSDASGNWYKMPFVAGDKLYFPITITSPANQSLLVGPRSVNIDERTYLIKCIVTDSPLTSTPGPDGSTSNQLYSV